MSRIIVNFPFVFNSLSGVQPASELDDNFTAIDFGTISIRTQMLFGSTTLVTNDEFSFFLCQPTNDMNITAPGSMAAYYSFFVSNQSSTKNVTLIGPWTIDGLPFMNPVLPGSFGSLSNVRGGLAVFDGATLRLFPQLFISGGGDGVSSLAVQGNPLLTGDVTLIQGSNVTLSQSGQNITIASGGGGGGPGGALTLVETKVITSNTQTVTFSGLDGNTDRTYKLIWRVKNNGGAGRTYSIRPNGSSANLQMSYVEANSGGIIGAAETDWLFSNNVDGTWNSGEAIIHAAVTVNAVSGPRMAEIRGIYTQTGTGNRNLFNGAGYWDDTSNNLTSIDFTASGANGIGNGSVISLYKYAQ